MENVNSTFGQSIIGNFGLVFFTLLFFFRCTPNPSPSHNIATMAATDNAVREDTGSVNTLKTEAPEIDTSYNKTPTPPVKKFIKPKTPPPTRQEDFTAVTSLDRTIRLDIRYATKNNFTKAQIYDCPNCLLRPAAAAALVKAHNALKDKGYGGLKMFDCYRPRPYQQRLWDKVPNPNYVTPPAKGSMHARGAAVDLTVVDKKGNELDMGTPYDFFGKQAHTDYTDLPANVLSNRQLLKEVMEAAGFKGIRTEWWHFSFRNRQYPLSDYVWPCE